MLVVLSGPGCLSCVILGYHEISLLLELEDLVAQTLRSIMV